MGGMTIGDGLAAIAFWGFVGAVVLAGIWYSASGRQAQHETLRRMIDSGQPADRELAERLLSHSADDGRHHERWMRAAGVIVLCAAPGLAVMGLLIRQIAAWAFYPLVGAAVLTACIGVGLLLAGRFVRQS